MQRNQAQDKRKRHKVVVAQLGLDLSQIVQKVTESVRDK